MSDLPAGSAPGATAGIMAPPTGALPMPGAGMPPMPGIVINPDFLKWRQAEQAWLAKKQAADQEFAAACELIRGDAVKRYKIDIEADSTIAADEQAEKAARTEFLGAVTPFLETMVPIAQQNPAFAPLIAELIMFGVRAFPASRSLEDAFESALKTMQDGAGQGQPPGQTGGKNTKSPIEIAAEASEAAGKERTAQQANATKLIQIQTEAAIEREKLMTQQQKDAAGLAMQGREIDGREALENARIQHMAARDTAGLV